MPCLHPPTPRSPPSRLQAPAQLLHSFCPPSPRRRALRCTLQKHVPPTRPAAAARHACCPPKHLAEQRLQRGVAAVEVHPLGHAEAGDGVVASAEAGLLRPVSRREAYLGARRGAGAGTCVSTHRHGSQMRAPTHPARACRRPRSPGAAAGAGCRQHPHPAAWRLPTLLRLLARFWACQ